MSKFFIKKDDIDGKIINIAGENVNHIKNVLRMKKGDIITVNDNEGTDYTVELMDFTDSFIVSSILEINTSITEPVINVTLYQGIPKSDKMDYIVQKSVELGIKKIVPVMTERTVVKFNNTKDMEKKRTRWQKISEEASKQCNRGIIPEVVLPVSFEEALNDMYQNELKIIPYENEKKISIKQMFMDSNYKNIAFIIGPEGGFSEKEIGRSMFYGVTPVTIGPRILRTETAGIALLSIIMYQYGDMG